MNERWLRVDWYDKEISKKISRIIQIEFELTTAVLNGHRPQSGDKYGKLRQEMQTLRYEILEIQM